MDKEMTAKLASRLVEYYRVIPEVFTIAEVFTNMVRSTLMHDTVAADAATANVRDHGVSEDDVDGIVSSVLYTAFKPRGVDAIMSRLIAGLYIWYAGEFSQYNDIYELAHPELVSSGLVFKFRAPVVVEGGVTPRTKCAIELVGLISELKSAGVTVRMLAETIGIKYATMYSWASGRRLPSTNKLGPVLAAVRRVRANCTGTAAEDMIKLTTQQEHYDDDNTAEDNADLHTE